MKKLVCLLLAFVLVLGLCACNGGGDENKVTAFSVGYGRSKVTDDDTESLPLAGYGNTSERMSVGLWDYGYTTCVAITDADNETALIYTNDFVRSPEDWVAAWRKAVNEATGVPEDKILFSATHTHSMPDISVGIGLETDYGQYVLNAVVTAAKTAMADRAPAAAEIGNTQVDNMNWVRVYKTDKDIWIGDNFDCPDAGSPVGHYSDSDKLLQVLRFNREGKDPIVMINWQGHPTISSTGSDDARANKYLASSDYIGAVRDYVEEETGALFAFYLSGSGNLNAYSRIAGEGFTKNHKEYGKILGKKVVEVLDDMKETQTGDVKTKQLMYTGEGSTGQRTMELDAVAAGNVAFVTAPYEMFWESANDIKTKSPYDMTFVLTCANGVNGYMPIDEHFELSNAKYPNSYEVRQCKFVRGTAEKLVDEFVGMLNELKG